MRNRATKSGFLLNSVSKFTGPAIPVYGLYIAVFAVGASLSPSHAREKAMRRHRLDMTRLHRNLLVVIMLVVDYARAIAQKPGQGQDKRPPKERVRVTTNDRKDNPPPRNTNQPRPGDKKKP
jgi:hypothetical protein